jgi:NTP pyrophosphatase (non-canonical NTP hydrolase)
VLNLRQRELHDWQFNNFGNNTDAFKGMVEEVGELAHALLKYKQHIREYDESSEARLKLGLDIEDAFGDIVIYGIQLMTDYGINAEDAINKTINKVLKRNWKDNPSGKDIDEVSHE